MCCFLANYGGHKKVFQVVILKLSDFVIGGKSPTSLNNYFSLKVHAHICTETILILRGGSILILVCSRPGRNNRIELQKKEIRFRFETG